MTSDKLFGGYVTSQRKNAEIWQSINEQLFGKNIPEKALWTDFEAIVSVLNIIGLHQQCASLFFPEGGDEAFAGVERSYEDECIELTGKQPIIVRPIKLLFGGFSDITWNFFWLQTGGLRLLDFDHVPSYEQSSDRLCLYELEGGKYHPKGYEQHLSEHDQSNIERMRTIKWFHSGGTFLIACKASIYSNPSMEGRHYKAGYEKFHSSVKAAFERLKELQ